LPPNPWSSAANGYQIFKLSAEDMSLDMAMPKDKKDGIHLSDD
jgi:hypothetical protein